MYIVLVQISGHVFKNHAMCLDTLLELMRFDDGGHRKTNKTNNIHETYRTTKMVA